MVMVECPDPVTDVGLKLVPAPDGSPEVVNVTVPPKLFCGVTVMVLVPLFPCVSVTLVGDADKPKSGVAAAFTVRLTVVV